MMMSRGKSLESSLIPKQARIKFGEVFDVNSLKPRKSKDQTLPIGSRESFIWIILKTILCLVLDFQGKDKPLAGFTLVLPRCQKAHLSVDQREKGIGN